MIFEFTPRIAERLVAEMPDISPAELAATLRCAAANHDGGKPIAELLTEIADHLEGAPTA